MMPARAAPLLALCLAFSASLEAKVASVDLGSTDAVKGVQNTQRGDGSDGENDASTCGPAGATRQGRTNRGSTDDDVADLYGYFLVTDAEVKSSPRLRISATFHDDVGFAGQNVRVRLHYTNAASTGPGDIANTFSAHAVVLSLPGSGKWVRQTWTVSDAGFRTFMQSSSDFRFDFGTARVCTDRVDVGTDPAPVEATEHLVAAHYYPWYTVSRWSYAECVAGALRLDLVEPQPPLLGKYDSSTPSVVDQHLRWCAEYGVNVLILEFISPNSREDQICRNVLFPHARSDDVQYTVLYDWAIRFGSFDVTPARITTAKADFDHLARFYFEEPTYLKVRGERPVVMIYVTRAFTGDVGGLIDGVREACASRGFDVFLVGDEFFFISAPSASKIARWDGIFGYDCYASRGGHWGSNGNLDLFRQRTASYRQTAEAAGVKFFPSCAPGYNDRAIRRTCADHPALSRRVTAGDGPTSLFREVFRETALKQVNAEVPLIAITSFNEWHEDTQIEPTKGTGASTAVDSSASGSAYTQGLAHDDYGLEHLELVRDATVAVAGRVLGPDGPVAGAAIEVLDGASVVLTRKSFSSGAYTIPRLKLSTGKAYKLRASAPGYKEAESAPVTVLGDRTQTGIDLTLGAVPKVSRGDCNADHSVDISDAVALLFYLFAQGRRISCAEACDADESGDLNVTDSLYVLRFLFRGGPPPAPPGFPACEVVPGADQCEAGNCV